MNKTVFIYARRSSEKNKENSISIDKQITEIKKRCEEKWLIIEWVYKDNKSWFVKWKRDDFSKMLEDVKNRNIKWKWLKIDYLYVFMVSRLARNIEEANLIIDMVTNNKLKILSIRETYEPWLKWEKKLILDLTEATYESKEKSQNAKIDMDISYRDKWKIARKPCYWYTLSWRWDRTKIIINNENNEGNIVKLVFNEYSNWKYTYKTLKDKLNKDWYQKSYYKKWDNNISLRSFTEKDIESILINNFYWWKVEAKYTNLTEDEIKFFKETYPDLEVWDNVIVDYTNIINNCWSFEPLINKSIFEKCKNIREWKKWKNKDKNYIETKEWKKIPLFKWLLKCNCKKCITENINEYYTFTQENQKWNFYYRCSNNRKNSVNCENSFVSEKLLEENIYENFIKWLIFSNFEKEIFKEIVEYKLKELWEIKDNSKKILITKLNNLKKEENKYYELYINENDSDFKEAHKKNYKNIKEEIKETENQLNILPNILDENKKYINDYMYYINEIWTNFINFPKERKQQMLKAFFEYIIVYNKEIIEFELNPIFELAYNKKKILTLNKNTWINKKDGSNHKSGLNKTKRTQSNDYVLDGTPTWNRTKHAGFGVLHYNRLTMEVYKSLLKEIYFIIYWIYKMQ